MRKFLYIIFLLLFSMAWSQESKSPTGFFAEIDSEVIHIPSSFSQGVEFISIRNYFLFEPGKSDIDSTKLDTIIQQYGNFLVRNPDAILMLKGYYSSKFDNILSPKVGQELSKKRADAIFRAIALKFPAIGDRVLVSDDHNFEASFLDSASSLDTRVEFDISVREYSERKFYPKQRAPYWRESYKNIINDITPILNSVFSSNPDIDAIIVGDGFKSDRKGYQWLAFLKKRLCEKIDERFSKRIALYINPFSARKVPSAKLILVPSINCGGIEKILWQKPIFSPAVVCSIDGIETLPNEFYCSFNIFDKFRVGIDKILSSDMKLNLGEIPVVPADFGLDFSLGEFGIAKKSPVLKIESTDSFSGVWSFKIFKPEHKKFLTFGGAGMWNVANAIHCISEVADQGKITMIASGSNDSLAVVEAQKFWDILATQICFITDTKPDKLGSWFEKNNFDVELSPPSKTSDEIIEKTFTDENSIEIIVQFLGNTR